VAREKGVEDSSLADTLLTPQEAEPEEAAPASSGASARVKGLGRIFRGNRALWITSLVAVICLVAGLVVGRFVLSPADAAANANAPKPGYITVPVEFGELSNDVTIRGQVGYADATEVKLTPGEGVAVITGRVPKVGDDLDAGSIALEIAGRPVFVLSGQLPAYRTLRHGSSGPDVAQLKKALNQIGIKAGKGDTYDKQLADAVRTLYEDAGYTPPVDKEARDRVRAAQTRVREADQGVASAKKALREGGTISSSTRKQLDNAVRSAERDVTVARAALKATDSSDTVAIATARKAVADAEDALALARVQRREGLKKPDTSYLRTQVKAAEQERTDAGKELSAARNAARPYLPEAEVLFLTELPRRVDNVNVARGSTIDGPVMSVSGATIELTGSAAAADAKLLEVGAEAFFELPDGTEHRAVIAKIDSESGATRATITFTPDPMETEVIQQIQGTNVRVKIPVGATEGDVLSVPFAALTAGPGGESRVEVVDGDPRDPQAKTRLVVVTTGLAAGGYVEVTPTNGELKAGDLVVVGA
jgi:peptidoglycan hydrolase-like protein with peptidoglycan-binding domain